MYNYEHYKLARDPLSMVLCQIRFSKVRRMPEYISSIYDLLKKEGFTEDVGGTVQRIMIAPDGQGQVIPQVVTEKREEFRTRDNHWSVLIGEEMISLVTTAYDRFEGFSNSLSKIFDAVDSVADIKSGQVRRIGIRYVDVIDPPAGKTYRDFLKPSLHGPTSDVFTESGFVHMESGYATKIGTMNVRLTQNNQGIVFPAEIAFPTELSSKTKIDIGNLITLIDLDHYVEGAWDFDIGKVLATVDGLHQGINAVWFKDLITPFALEAWEAEKID